MQKTRRALPVAVLLAAGCSAEGFDPKSAPEQNLIVSTRAHVMPWRDSRSPSPYSAPAGAHLTYYGGRVVSNVQTVQVLWGSGSYLAQVTSTATPSVATFYQQVTNSAYFDWLTEYNTPASGGTNQQIGRGSFAGQYTITPSVTGTTVSDTQIQSEIAAQISAGHLPAPTTDAAGNVNTYYAVFFPHGIRITQGGSSSCVAGGFCAFHGTFTRSGQHLYYGVHPDMQAGSGCDTGCGSGTPFGNYTSVASHELVETVTDAEVGLATVVGPPLAWYDGTNGEIGDICNAQQGSVTGTDGVTYTVQKEFSNSVNDCIVSKANDFSLSANPGSVTIAAGSSGTSTINTTTSAGSAQTVNLTVSGAPSGVTTTLTPTSVTSGQSSTLNIATTSSAAAGTYTLTVTGTAPSGSHSTTVSLTITSGGGGGGGTGITNGGFETGTLSGWTAAGTAAAVSGQGHGGTYAARVGGTAPTSGDSSIAQTFTAPTGATGLSLYYKVICPDTITYDWATATLKDNTTGTTTTVVPKTCTNSGAWVNATAALTAGHGYTLTLVSHDDNYAGDPTYTYYDDVTITTGGGGGGGGGGGITNGGFETGTLSGWTSAGAASVTATAHSGTYSALLGAVSATNGDSSVSQTFTVPAGKTQLSFWYANNCPDTVTYDWATVMLTDNTANTTTTVLPRTCAATYTWTNKTASVTAGHSYTLKLVSHDDNYAADPTYTLYDDVTLN